MLDFLSRSKVTTGGHDKEVIEICWIHAGHSFSDHVSQQTRFSSTTQPSLPSHSKITIDVSDRPQRAFQFMLDILSQPRSKNSNVTTGGYGKQTIESVPFMPYILSPKNQPPEPADPTSEHKSLFPFMLDILPQGRTHASQWASVTASFHRNCSIPAGAFSLSKDLKRHNRRLQQASHRNLFHLCHIFFLQRFNRHKPADSTREHNSL
jgi:hypothetical protein